MPSVLINKARKFNETEIPHLESYTYLLNLMGRMVTNLNRLNLYFFPIFMGKDFYIAF